MAGLFTTGIVIESIYTRGTALICQRWTERDLHTRRRVELVDVTRWKILENAIDKIVVSIIQTPSFTDK